MEGSRKLRLVTEALVELDTDELRRMAGGRTDLCNPCIFTWSCDDIKTLQCLQTRVCG